MPWFRGNTHAHTTRSDGDLELDRVVAWYAARNYDWLAITDHCKGLARDEAERLSREHGLLVIPANEFNLECCSAHVVGLGITEDFDKKQHSDVTSVVGTLQTCVDEIRDRGGLPILTHPNWLYTWGAHELLQIRDCNLFEVHNAGSDCNTFAAGGEPGTDDIWDEVLNAGMRIYGVACDDSHKYRPETFHASHNSAHGAEGWTYVECDECTESSVLAALSDGRCVASSGAAPIEVGLQQDEYVVKITDPYKWFRFTTTFIGPDGVLDTCHGREVSCKLTGNEKWVRARVFCSSGKYLWTQPAFPE